MLCPFASGLREFTVGRDSGPNKQGRRHVRIITTRTGPQEKCTERPTGSRQGLRAGLMPRLAAGALGPGSERWPRRVIRPTSSPLRELAIQLADVAGADPISVRRALSAAPGEAP